MNNLLPVLVERVDKLEKSILKIEKMTNKDLGQDIKKALEEVIDNKSRDTKLNLIIILLIIGVCIGTFAVFSLYQLAS